MKSAKPAIPDSVPRTDGEGGHPHDRLPPSHLSRRATAVAFAMAFLTLALAACDNKSIAQTVYYGIQIQAVRLSAADHMVGIHYRITDAEQAAQLIRRGAKICLVDMATGYKFATPLAEKIGSLGDVILGPGAGKTFFVFFANSSGLLKRGAKVRIVMGDYQSDPLVVE